jgi:hypothetical protein
MGVTVLFLLVAMGFRAFAFGTRFRLYSLAFDLKPGERCTSHRSGEIAIW